MEVDFFLVDLRLTQEGEVHPVSGDSMEHKEAQQAIRQATADAQARRVAEGWQFLDELKVAGRLPLIRGRRFQITGRRGWWRFTRCAVSPAGQVTISCSGPYTKHEVSGNGAARSFALMDAGLPPVRGCVIDDIRIEIRRVEQSKGTDNE